MQREGGGELRSGSFGGAGSAPTADSAKSASVQHPSLLATLRYGSANFLLAGWKGMLVLFLAGLIGRLFHELINYVQHYGLVRVENTPIRPHHSWDCYRTISNAVHYNLPRHSDHHMFATKAFWQLDVHQDAPTLPYGYQTMASSRSPRRSGAIS